jgi:hypothetical protein
LLKGGSQLKKEDFMRTSIVLAAGLVMAISSSALADDEVQPKVVTTTNAELPPGGYVTPTIVPYEGGVIPNDAKLVAQPNLAFLGTGIGLFAASYAGALIYALSTCSAQETCRGGSGYLYIPFIGPFVTAAVNETPTTGGRALAAFDGGVQLLGGALSIAAFVWPKKFVMWQGKSASVQVTPTTMGAGTSAGVAVTVTNF